MSRMTQVTIKCPSCGKMGKINISMDTLKSSDRGLMAVSIAKDIICPHTFLAYIDRNLNVRDYFIADFQVKIPEISSFKKIKESTIPSKEIIDIDLIKLNISAMTLTYIIKSIFLKQKIVLIFDQKFLYNHILNFFQYLTRDNFETDISIVNSDVYKDNKKRYKDAMVFKESKIIRNNKNLINPKKLHVEKNIVSKFFSEQELGFSYITLKNEIFKVYELSKQIKDYVEKENQRGKQANVLKVQNELEKVYEIKIDKLYLRFLIDIVINYFKVSAPSLIAGLFDFL